MIRSAHASLPIIIGAALAGLAATAFAQERQASPAAGNSLRDNFLAQHEIGYRFQVTPN